MTPKYPFNASPMGAEEIQRIALELVRELSQIYQPGRDRVVTPKNVYQPAVTAGQPLMEKFALTFALPGSCVEGLKNLDDCLARMERGEKILFLPEHRGNLDVSTFFALLRLEDPKYEQILQKLIYIAGRKLNESSELIKMYTEKYSRLVIVPRRDFPRALPREGETEQKKRLEFEQTAGRINRAAFRELLRLREQGFLFVLFPLGGREKPDADMTPVRETATYLRAFDTCFLVSMEGNILPPLPRMEDERPRQAEVVFRVGAAMDSKAFLAEQRRRFETWVGSPPALKTDFEQFTANQIMKLLAALRQGEPPETAAGN